MNKREIDLGRDIDPFTIWDERAKIPGLRSVMSLGLSEREAQTESEKLVASVFDFLGDELRGKDVLEIGTGIGRFTIHLSTQANTLITIDLSQEMINRAKVNCNGVSSLNFLRASGCHIPSDDTKFEWVFEVTVLLHMPDEQFIQIIEEAKRVLKPDGKFFLCGPIDPEQRRQIHQYAIHRTMDEYRQALDPFSVSKVRKVKCGNDNYTMIVAS